MSGPLEQAGAAREPSEYATIAMAEQFTGMVTNSTPFRDPKVPYVEAKFYGASRFDRIIDGLNREISAQLADVRRPGSSSFNANTLPPMSSFYPWKYQQDGAEVITVVGDGSPISDTLGRGIFDLSATSIEEFSTKKVNAGPARFLGVNNQLFFNTGTTTAQLSFGTIPEQILAASKTWQPNTSYNLGDLVLIPSSLGGTGTLHQAFSIPLTLGIESVQQFSATSPSGTTTQYVILILDDAMGFPANWSTVALSGLTSATWLNGATLTHVVPIGVEGNALQGVTTVSHAAYGPAADTGTAVGVTLEGSGLSGGTMPTWAVPQLGLTVDNQITWRNFGTQDKDWGLPAPSSKPGVQPAYNTELYWQSNTVFPLNSAVLDSNQNIEVVFAVPGPGTTSGFNQPKWSTVLGAPVQDGSLVWFNCGQAGSWVPSTNFPIFSAILDVNGNLQVVNAAASPGLSGTSVPSWATSLGATTTDNNLTWINVGPGTVLAAGQYQYAWSWHSIDGSVSDASPINATIVNGVLGAANPGFAIAVSGLYPAGDPLNAPAHLIVDEIWLWRTAVGEPTLIFLNSFPVLDLTTANWSYLDLVPDFDLVAQIAAPIAEQNAPPPLNITAPVYHLKRVWGISGNSVVWSGGPDTVVGNGNTAFPPLNFWPFQSQPIRLEPITVQDGGLLVFTTGGIFIGLGSGTATEPFYFTEYYSGVSIMGYNAVARFNTTLFVMESNKKVSAISIQYPFDPATGYAEVGFPIGDQFQTVTTGGVNAALFNPATAYLTWDNAGTGDSALIVSDGAGNWFRMAPVTTPETGFMWGTLAQVTGGASAIQSIETGPGLTQLLIAPAEGTRGPITFRDNSTNGDWNGTEHVPYPSWDVKGSIVLCQSGEVSEIAHIGLKSAAVGNRPVLSLLLNEIEPTETTPWLDLMPDPDPVEAEVNVVSETYYSDRYVALDSSRPVKCDTFQMKVDYGVQNVADELWMFAIYGAKHQERKQQ